MRAVEKNKADTKDVPPRREFRRRNSDEALIGYAKYCFATNQQLPDAKVMLVLDRVLCESFWAPWVVIYLRKETV